MSTPVRKIVQKTLSPRIFKSPNASFLQKSAISQDVHLLRSPCKSESAIYSGTNKLHGIELNNSEFCNLSPAKKFSKKLDDFIIHKPNKLKNVFTTGMIHGKEIKHSFLQVPKQKYVPSVNTPERDELLKTDLSNLNLNILGKGSFGTVVLAIYKGENVAMKIIPKKNTSLLLEANALILNHSNILRVLLAESGSNYDLVIMENCCASDMQSILDDKDTKIPFEIYSKWVLDICAALQYCHQNRILHLDVKPKNILVKGNNCLLCDFGSSLNLDSLEQRNGYLFKLLKGCGGSTIAYNAPEMLNGSDLPTAASDVYALGVTMYHIYTRMPPFNHLDSAHSIIYQVVKYNLRPEMPKSVKSCCSCEVSFCKLYQHCWAQASIHRPTVYTLINSLQQFRREHDNLCSENT